MPTLALAFAHDALTHTKTFPLRTQHNLRIAAVVNEYGSVDHDGGVLERGGQTDSVDKLMGWVQGLSECLEVGVRIGRERIDVKRDWDL